MTMPTRICFVMCSVVFFLASSSLVEGFSETSTNFPRRVNNKHLSTTRAIPSRRTKLILAAGSDDWDEPDLKSILEKRGITENSDDSISDIDDDFAERVEGINPLNYDASSSSKTSAKSTAGYSTRISLRATRMQDLNRALLDAVTAGKDRDEQMRKVLEENNDFLLEPLEDEDAVLEADSIFKPNMSRADRYQAYRASMNERIESSRNLKVRAVLEAMRDFVLEFE